MKTLLIAVAAAAAILAAPPRANASPIDYTFSGASITFDGSGTDTITGSFVYDSSLPSQQLSSVNITVSGPVYPSVSSQSFCTPCAPNQIYFGLPGGIPDYVMDFGSNLNGAAASLTFGSFYSNSTLQLFQSSNVSGSVLPIPSTPLPTALPLFASGLGALGVLGWRRKKKATALAA